jgi:23S rRNA pseudouridine2457 synthase
MSKYLYFVLYKPFGVLSQFSGLGQTLSMFSGLPKDVYAVGRLDAQSEGLLLLTNDNSLNEALLHPSRAHWRTYYAQVEGIITEQALQKLASGVEIRVEKTSLFTRPAKAKAIETPVLPERVPPIRYRKTVPDSWLSLSLVEGKKHQVRKMTAAVGFPTLRLVRYSIEELTIEGFQSGEIREYDVVFIKKMLRL